MGEFEGLGEFVLGEEVLKGTAQRRKRQQKEAVASEGDLPIDGVAFFGGDEAAVELPLAGATEDGGDLQGERWGDLGLELDAVGVVALDLDVALGVCGGDVVCGLEPLGDAVLNGPKVKGLEGGDRDAQAWGWEGAAAGGVKSEGVLDGEVRGACEDFGGDVGLGGPQALEVGQLGFLAKMLDQVVLVELIVVAQRKGTAEAIADLKRSSLLAGGGEDADLALDRRARRGALGSEAQRIADEGLEA